ncbi:N-acetyltransferase [Maribellus sp. CM-23]|uniref:acyltransferase n=1 Tax=Maribellus sp. CM-23 TaxID=2781026 RepID=UPI001F2EAF64|nr:acyltransferase [Maribellus sp. CM-23]MCE4566662.1 N-acetyltransferase [Maribellus sp. CM-23]
MTKQEYYAHETAAVDQGAKIGSGTKIWHFSHVMGGAEIGANCVLGQNVFVGNNVKLGNNVKVQNNVSVYEGVLCEDDVFLGPSMVFTNVINPRSAVDRKREFKKTLVKRGATIGANATIICGVTLGEYCMIGAGAVVTKDVKAFALMTGVPARQTGWVSRAGMVLGDDLVCTETGEKYELENDQLKLAADE